MMTIETMKHRAAELLGKTFPLVLWSGTGEVAAVSETTLDLVVRGTRVSITWDRMSVTLRRLEQNHVLTSAELGGQADAIGIVSLLALLWPAELHVLDEQGMVRLKSPEGTPVHQYVDVSRPVTWHPMRRKIHGG
jgi:hypothetical protein